MAVCMCVHTCGFPGVLPAGVCTHHTHTGETSVCVWCVQGGEGRTGGMWDKNGEGGVESRKAKIFLV